MCPRMLKPPPKSPLTANETRALYLLLSMGGLTEAQLAEALGVGQTWAESVLKFQLAQRRPALVTQEDAPSGRRKGRPPKLYKINPAGITLNPFTWLVLFERYHHLDQPGIPLPTTDLIASRVYNRIRYLADINLEQITELHLYLRTDAIPLGYIAEPYPSMGRDLLHLTPKCVEHMPFIDLMALLTLANFCTDIVKEILGQTLLSAQMRGSIDFSKIKK
jgi:hypothetical protein